MRPSIKLRHLVEGAVWDEEEAVWRLKVKNLESGEGFEESCNFLLDATGILKWVLFLSASWAGCKA